MFFFEKKTKSIRKKVQKVQYFIHFFHFIGKEIYNVSCLKKNISSSNGFFLKKKSLER
jgi:hypothetical protein